MDGNNKFPIGPLPLPTTQPAVKPFEIELLPDAFQPWIDDISNRIQCPPDFPAVAAMVALSGVVGRRIGIRPKRRDDWSVTANLWGAIIGRPGLMKTPALQEPLKPLKRLEIEAKAEYLEKCRQYKADQMIRDAKKKLAQQKIATALKKANGDESKIAQEFYNDDDSPPFRTRFQVNDSTVEKLGEILNQNPMGITVYRDELTGLLTYLDKEENKQARAFYMEAWNGNGRYTYDRIGRGTIDIEAATVAILGGIQPDPLQQYLVGNSKHGNDDGLLQRFQLIVWPDISTSWKNVDEWPNKTAREAAHQVYFDLAELDPRNLAAVFEDSSIPYLRFSKDAQDIFNEWRGRLEIRLRSGEDNSLIESHLSKYRSLIPSLALIDHLTTARPNEVQSSSIEKAIRWADYLESHAQRVYGSCSDGILAAWELGKRIIKGDLRLAFTARDVYRNHWRNLGNTQTVEDAANILIDHNWLIAEQVNTTGRPKTMYLANPAIKETKYLLN